MKRFGTILLAGLAVLAFTGGSAMAAPNAQPVTGGHWEARMSAQNGSGEDGTVTASAVDSTHTEVVVQLANGTTTPQPAHVHEGTCAALSPKPKYPLNNVVDGMSDTVIAVSLDDLLHGGYAVNVHKSAAEATTYVSCGDTFVNTAGGLNPGPGMPATGAGAQPLILLGLVMVAFGLLSVGLRVRRSAF